MPWKGCRLWAARDRSLQVNEIAGDGQLTRREAELTAQGWQKKTTVDEPRLSELVQAYRRIGCEVHLEPFDPFEQPSCSECLKTTAKSYKTIYVRKTANGGAADAERC
jgi:hypothetical protein